MDMDEGIGAGGAEVERDDEMEDGRRGRVAEETWRRELVWACRWYESFAEIACRLTESSCHHTGRPRCTAMRPPREEDLKPDTCLPATPRQPLGKKRRIAASAAIP